MMWAQYRSIAFYRNEKEKQIIEAEIKRFMSRKKIIQEKLLQT